MIDKKMKEKNAIMSENNSKEQLISKVMKVFDYDSCDNDESCSICLEIFRDGMKIAKLRCNHLFHTDCINRWFEVNFTCPLCKRI